MTEERIDGGGSPIFQLVIEDAEFEENDDGIRTLVGGELSHIEMKTDGGDE